MYVCLCVFVYICVCKWRNINGSLSFTSFRCLVSNGKRKPKTLILGGIGGGGVVLVSTVGIFRQEFSWSHLRSEMAEQVKCFKLGAVYV